MSDTKTGSLKLSILKDIPIFLHWSFPAGGALIYIFAKFALPETIYYCIAYTVLILLHELAHAYTARRLGLKVLRIEITGAGGRCSAEYPSTFIAAIAYVSAGILLQALLLIGTIFYLDVFGKPTSIFGKCLAIAFMFVNGVMIVLNIIPIKRPEKNIGTDGYLLWKLIGNRIRGKPYTFPDTSATFSTKTKLTRLQGFMPKGFTTGIEILNDNTTTMEFVVSTLTTHLKMTQEDAIAAMLDIHKKGGRLISLPTYEEAVSVASAITSDAIANGFKLICRPVKVQQRH